MSRSPAAYGQLAEEAAGLAQAAAKMERVLRRESPTPITEKEAKAAVIEELNDVLVAANVIAGLGADEKMANEKIARWRARIKEKEMQEA